MKYVIFLIFVLIFCSGFIGVAVSYQPNLKDLETAFRTNLPNNVIYTQVPRGLIITVDEKYFFNDGEARIKESSLPLLDKVAQTLNALTNYCVVENHTENNNLSNSDYKEDWELSMARSANIVEYLTKYGGVSTSKLFALGFGQYMPFWDNVAPKNGPENRIDFVIIDYMIKR
jgi:chemotaxis protein MotB